MPGRPSVDLNGRHRAMLELEAAVEKILHVVPKPHEERVPAAEAAERFLTADVHAECDVPPFDNSAMDGYAVIAADVAKASETSPIKLKAIGRAAAGEVFSGKVTNGTCVRLFTGSPLPKGANAVVMQEDVMISNTDAAVVRVREGVKPWENVRFAGEDVKRGAVVGRPGEQLSAGRIALLNVAGCSEVSVAKRPVVGLLATGSELVEPGNALGPGQIYESNRAMIASLSVKAGAEARVYPIIRDDLAATRKALTEAFVECDIVITSGGVSVGEMDFVKQGFTDIGGTMDFWKVAIRPGRPFVFGQLKTRLFCGLPGNPVSALVTFLLLVRPAILRWQGAAETTLPSHPARLVETVSNDSSRRTFMRVAVDSHGRARPAGIQASHILSSVANANALLDLPAGATFHENDAVSVLRFA